MSIIYKEYLTEDEAAEFLGIDVGVLLAWPHKLGLKIYKIPGVGKRILKLGELDWLDKVEVQGIASTLKVYPGLQRRRAKNLRTTKWADKKAIADIYAEAKRFSIETGIKHHVDHEIPLQGKLVSGLHVPANLRIIPASKNFKKLNRYTP